MNKKVLVIIVNYNGVGYLKDCLPTLKNTKYDNYQVLLIDNASTDGSVGYIKGNWSEYTLIQSQENLGFAAGNNLGFEYAIKNNFDYVYLLNQDTEVDPDFISEAVSVVEADSQIGAVQSKLMLFEDKEKINSLGNEIHFLGFGYAGGYKLNDRQLEISEITYPSGASVLIRVKALKDIGLFNPDFFMYHEDLDLGWRLWIGGYKVVLAPKSLVYHKYEFSRSITKYYYMERNRYLVIFQNYKISTLILIFPALIAMDLSMFLYSFIGGWYKEYLKVVLYFLKTSSWKKLKRTRKQIQSKRKVGDRILVDKLVGKIEFQDVSNPLLKYLVNPAFNFYWQIIKRFIV